MNNKKILQKAFDSISVGELYEGLEHKIINMKCNHYELDVIMECTENILAHIFKKALPNPQNIAPIMDILKNKILEKIKPKLRVLK